MKKLFFMLFVIAVIASLIVFRVPLIEKMSPKVAKYYGFDVSRFEIGRLDIDQIVVPMLAMQQVDGNMRTKIEIHNLVADVDTYKAKVSAVSSSYVYIDIEDIGGTASVSKQQGVKDIVNLLPIFGISVERLKIKYRANNEELVRFEGQVLYAQNATLKGVLSSQDKFNLAVDLYIDELDFAVNASQNNNDKAVIALTGNYQVKDDWLDVKLKGDLSFSAINQFLRVFGVDEYVQQDVSTVSAKFELDLTRSTQDVMQSFAADVELDSTLNIASKNLSIKEAQIDVSASCRVERMDAANCAFKDPQRAVVAFYNTPDWLREHFDGIGNEYIFEINPSDQLAVKLSSKEILLADVKGDASFNIRSQSSRLKVGAVVSDLSFNGIAQDWQLDADYKLAFEALDVSTPAKISRLLAKGRGKLSADEKRANIQIYESLVINALNTAYEGYEAKSIQFKQVNDAQFVYRYQNNHVQADNVRYALTLNQLGNTKAEVQLNESPIQLEIKNIDYSSVNQKIVAQIEVDKISLTERGIPVRIYGFNAGANLKDNQFSVDGHVGLGEQKHKLKFYATHDVLTGIGQATINADAIALANNEIISRRISDSGFPLQLKGGTLDLGIDAIWNSGNSASEISVKLLADQVMGDYAQNQFTGFNTALEFVGQDGWSLKQAANINIDIFNVGVPVKDVSMRLERMEYGKQEKPLIHLSDLAASVLDGSIYSEKIEIDLNRRENMFTILMSSLSLEKLIALNQTEDLIASGTINGELPMRLDNGVLLMDQGWLRADDSGGYIKYGRIEEVLAGNKNLKLVGELLKDFQYNEMSAQVDLLSGGRVTLATRLHGRSPNAELNKQVNLNFNIDFNLWKFLESARLLTRIDQDITKQILSKPKQ